MERNRLIDGWRGVSVLLVVIAHIFQFRLADHLPRGQLGQLLREGHQFAFAAEAAVRVICSLGALGVSVFFVISGYLITTLLLQEEKATGRISVAAFYARRAARILPALFAYLFGVWLLSVTGNTNATNSDLIRAGLLFTNFDPNSISWSLKHTWSLAVEEQFYLVWPCMLLALTTYRASGLLIILAGLAMMSWLGTLTVDWLDNAKASGCIAIGALYASSSRMRIFVDRCAASWAISAASALLLSLPLLRLKGLEVVTPLLVAIVFFGTLNAKGPILPLISTPAIRLIGLASYSIYLWQALATGPSSAYRSDAQLAVFAIMAAILAIASYLWIERPGIALGRRISARLQIGSPNRVINALPSIVGDAKVDVGAIPASLAGYSGVRR